MKEVKPDTAMYIEDLIDFRLDLIPGWFPSVCGRSHNSDRAPRTDPPNFTPTWPFEATFRHSDRLCVRFLARVAQSCSPGAAKDSFCLRGASKSRKPTFPHKVSQESTKSRNKDCQVTSKHAKWIQKPSRAAQRCPRASILTSFFIIFRPCFEVSSKKGPVSSKVSPRSSIQPTNAANVTSKLECLPHLALSTLFCQIHFTIWWLGDGTTSQYIYIYIYTCIYIWSVVCFPILCSWHISPMSIH